MPTKRNYLVKVIDAKIVDVKRALESKGIKLESIYEMFKENVELEKVATPAADAAPVGAAPSTPPAKPVEASKAPGPPSEAGGGTPAPSDPSAPPSHS